MGEGGDSEGPVVYDVGDDGGGGGLAPLGAVVVGVQVPKLVAPQGPLGIPESGQNRYRKTRAPRQGAVGIQRAARRARR